MTKVAKMKANRYTDIQVLSYESGFRPAQRGLDVRKQYPLTTVQFPTAGNSPDFRRLNGVARDKTTLSIPDLLFVSWHGQLIACWVKKVIVSGESNMSSSRKSRFDMTPEKFERFLREGRGMGSGAAYRPWIQIDDLSSKGRCYRTASALTGYRTHHFLSDNEYFAYLNAWWDESVLDIREQYPLLSVRLTLAIAKSIGVRHPVDTRIPFTLPQTSDLLLITKDGAEVVAVKEDKDAQNSRTKETLAIAETFWKNRNISTRLALASTLKTQRSLNLTWIYHARRKQTEKVLMPGASRFYDYIVSVAAQGSISSLELSSRCDEALGVPRGSSLARIRRLLAERVLITNINEGDIAKECGLAVGRKWL